MRRLRKHMRDFGYPSKDLSDEQLHMAAAGLQRQALAAGLPNAQILRKMIAAQQAAHRALSQQESF